MMVLNNFRHKGVVGLNAIAFILLNKNVSIELHDTLEDAETCMRLFHYIYAKNAEIKQLADSRKKLAGDTMNYF